MADMNIAVFERCAKELKLAETLLNIRAARLNGARGHSLGETREVLTKTIESARVEGKRQKK